MQTTAGSDQISDFASDDWCELSFGGADVMAERIPTHRSRIDQPCDQKQWIAAEWAVELQGSVNMSQSLNLQ
jgi:hypothetical protein